MYKSVFNSCFLIIFSLFLSSCGLPSSAVVDPPVVTSSDIDLVSKSFLAPADDQFIDGYEVYYKIYSTFDTSEIISDRDQFDVTGSNYKYEFGDIKPNRLGFKRLIYGDTETSQILYPPLISTDSSKAVNLQANEEFLISLNAGNDRIEIDSVSIGIPLRIVKDEDGYYKPFLNNVIEGDSDANGVTDDVVYSVSFVAFSYVSSIITTNQSSYPVFIGTITDIAN
ncbi:MAG: hypothetical protein JEY91_07425 [Spirochaetaceae bacterium]|nr:hypothetical protein [Spirochaetaceae bacterium]